MGQKIGVEGVLAELRPDQHVFLCLKSQAFGRLIYPQGQVIPDGTGQWTVVSIYGTPGYSYETFLVSTSNPESATMLNAQQSRKYGMRDLVSSLTAPRPLTACIRPDKSLSLHVSGPRRVRRWRSRCLETPRRGGVWS